MTKYKVGDVVARKSYGADVIFKIVEIKNQGNQPLYVMKGVNYRIIADANEIDLISQNERNLKKEGMRFEPIITKITKRCNAMQCNMNNKVAGTARYRKSGDSATIPFFRSGKVLHLDGDEEYLEACMQKYKELKVIVIGKYVPEIDQPLKVRALLEEYEPDILVLTGHDGVSKNKNEYLNINNYRNSKYFVAAVKEARKYRSCLDELVIFAGACQSYYKELLCAGSNFASSPLRELIHTLDPVFVCEKIAHAHAEKMLSPIEVIKNTITGAKGIGGIGTRGKTRQGFPCDAYCDANKNKQ